MEAGINSSVRVVLAIPLSLISNVFCYIFSGALPQHTLGSCVSTEAIAPFSFSQSNVFLKG
ncbi:MAG: hypothetical protein KKF39_03630, partial [Nanoarchaeota archaeon]|nr:hypothetical protein [Nanoarchaeota archaeon]